MQALRQFASNVADRGTQSFEGRRSFVIVALDGYVNPRGTGIVRQGHAADGSQANSGISQLAFENGFDLLAKGFP